MMRSTRLYALFFMVACLFVGASLRLPSLPEVPPGVHYDEAANGVLAGEIGLEGKRPLFISSYTGKEVLFFYVAGGLMSLLGESTFSLRLASAFLGLLTISATYWLGREWQFDRRICLLASILLAVSFWHLLFSRLGFRAITQPLLQALMLAAMFRGLRKESWGWLALAGLFLGLTAYTYLAARLFPILLFFACIPLLAWGKRWRQLSVVVLVGTAVLAPLVNYFINNPDAFWVRISQVGPETSRLAINESFLRSLGMLFVQGDPYIRFNVPNMPLFGLIWGGFLLIGWAMVIAGLRRVPYDWQKASLLLLAMNPFVMILPTALATGEIVPSNLRAVGLMPLIFFLPAIGLVNLFKESDSPRIQSGLNVTLSLILFATLVIGGVMVNYTYFQQWATLPSLYEESDGDLTAVANFLDTLPANQTIYVASEHYQHPTLAFLSNRYSEIKWLPNAETLVFPAEGAATYIFPQSAPRSDWMARYLPTQLDTSTYLAPNGEPALTAYRLEAPLQPPPDTRTDINFGYMMQLEGYTTQPATAGDFLNLRLHWLVTGEPANAVMPFVHLEDAWQVRWSQQELFSYPSAQWQTGERIVQQVRLPVPYGTPHGFYTVRLGLFDPANGQQIGQFDANGRYAGTALTIPHVAVLSAPDLPPTQPQPREPASLEVVDGVYVLGFERGKRIVSTGETLDFDIWWRATEPIPPMVTRIELMRSDNTGIILGNLQPVHNTLPFATWQTPQFLIDSQAVRIPDTVETGEYRLQLRWLNSRDDTLGELSLGSVVVEQTERLYTVPESMATISRAQFGDEMMLAGYTLTQAEETAQLELVWQSVRPAPVGYTLFVHLLYPDGRCCIWQQDVQPRQNSYPTTRWLPTEIITDPYTIPLPQEAGTYPLEIGVYIAENGLRLPVYDPLDPALDNDFLLLKPIIVEE